MPYRARRGGQLRGSVILQGSKHTYSAIMIGAVLVNRKTIIKNFPRISDSYNMIQIFKELNINIKKFNSRAVMINGFVKKDVKIELSAKYISQFRDSIYIIALAPIFKEITIPNFFGGCLLGDRPITSQIKVLKDFGYSVETSKNSIKIIGAKKNIKNNKIILKKSVSVTKIAILIAAHTKAITILKNIATEPNVYDLISFLKKAGINIEFISEDSIKIKGGFRRSKNDLYHTLIPDRMEAVSFICALLITKGKIKIKDFNITLLGNAKNILEKMGVKFSISNRDVIAECSDIVSPVDFETGYYPLTCTDMQPLMAVPLCIAKGKSSIKETIFDDRWAYTRELLKMKADLRVNKNILHIVGKSNLTGSIVQGCDIRCTAALILAGLSTNKDTIITGEKYLNRAYDNFVNKLIKLGANIKFYKE
jgi:UDP-N-acetylglucosamine 1-carboxyvinyltransferase